MTPEEIKKLQDENASLKKANKDKDSAISELTAQVASATAVAGKKTVKIGEKQYVLLYPEITHEGKKIKAEDFIANEKLAAEVLEFDAGVFEEVVIPEKAEKPAIPVAEKAKK
ncbi:hypothetical protein VB796_08735 [Arcicella sp. LKC2W]|uniref:hypothetical protein n=1 Tax=Arcicella sp. LKC2W TaxID=2984198 RepID=UPI002B21226B|nr:hypothetical protein [Arcicella sp. LKC2W]MEA5459120.1 hypothetical protein [Arcicella sp. LKC2W]